MSTESPRHEKVAILMEIADGWSDSQNNLAKHLKINKTTLGDKLKRFREDGLLEKGGGITPLTEAGYLYIKNYGGWYEGHKDDV